MGFLNFLKLTTASVRHLYQLEQRHKTDDQSVYWAGTAQRETANSDRKRRHAEEELFWRGFEGEIQQILTAIAEWRPIPESLLKSLPVPMLQLFLAVIDQLKAEGLAEPHGSTADRVNRLMFLVPQLCNQHGVQQALIDVFYAHTHR